MRSTVQRLKAIVCRRGAETIYECRHCGTAVDAETEVCPDCGAEEIARYRVP